MADDVLDYHRAVIVPASLVKRAEAAATTAVPYLVWIIVSACLIHSVPLDSPLIPRVLLPVMDAAIIAIIYGLPIIVMALEGARTSATYGMRQRKIRFLREDGADLSYWHCFLRIFLGVMLLPLLPVSIVMAVMDPHRRMIADRLSGTVVVQALQLSP